MTEHFYEDSYYYSPTYYPGYNVNRKQEKRHIANFPYIKDNLNSKINLQVFYNTSNGDMPWGSTYKYTIPKSIDEILEQGHNSISERQKRFRLERFTNSKRLNNDNNNNNILLYLILFMIIFFMTNLLC